MASRVARCLVLASVRYGALQRGPSLKKDGDISAGRGGSGRSLVPSRSVIVTRSGAILPKPVKMSFGLLRVFSTVIPFFYVGTLISKNVAALLEEHDIFVPEDEDDDDYQVMKFRKEKAIPESRHGDAHSLPSLPISRRD